ncbi:MAG: DctP family TRAP transporter solute-binding subunit [Synergistetes bacterium]|nr:DctP family TRAP transporter solute-binding subunit [Synergistota bacterium]
MKKLGAFIVLLVVVLLAALSGSAMADKVFNMKLANAGPADPSDRTVIAVEVFKNYVYRATKGTIKVQAFHASQLGNEKEILEGLKIGSIELGTITTGPIPTLFKPIMVFDIPYLFPNKWVAWHVLDGPFGQKLMEDMRKATGIRCLAVSENGYRHFITAKKPIHSPADMKGLKIRTMENPAHMKMVEALGASPTPIAFGELYMALQQGVVDGAELPVTLINNMKFYEVQKYVILDGHLYNPLIIFINDGLWGKLSKHQKLALFEGAQLFKITQRALTERQVQTGLKHLKKMGMKIYVPTPKQLQEFRNLSQPAVLKYVRKEIGDKWVDEIIQAVKSAEKEELKMIQ